jgi:hypothetical protein
MQKEFIPYKQAVELKELGFNERCFGYYYTLNGKDWKFAEKSEYYRLDDEINIGGKFSLLVPLYQQAFRWFREKHRLYHDIKMFGDWDKPQYSYIVSGKTMGNPAHMWHYEDKGSYEEAEQDCLIKLIEIVKQPKKD